MPDFNEYVWVPMPDSSKFARNGWNMDTLGNETNKEEFWEETSSKEYTDMVSSVSNNKGFYISRYEASQKDSATAQSKRGQNTWIWVPQLNAITASSNMNTEINSHLVYGIEWDSVLKWAIDSQAIIGSETTGKTKTITIDDVQKDSRSWGNYYNSTGGAKTNSGDLQPGGTNEYWKVNNIYDLAGNVREWTQEKYSSTRASRGGIYYYDGDDSPAADRNIGININTNSDVRVQGRLLCVALYSGSIVL